MRGRILSVACVLTLLSFSPSTCAYVGEDNDLAVYITYPDNSYDVGSDIIVTVTVFKAADYYDTDEVTLGVGVDSREVGLTKEAVGRYKGVVTIQLADLSSSGYLTLAATAVESGWFGDEAYDYRDVETLVGSSFAVNINVPDTRDFMPAPGQDVDLVVDIKFRGTPVDPDADTLEVYYEDPAESRTDITVTRIGTGQFQGKVTVPAALKESTGYTLIVDAEYTKDGRTYECHQESEVFVTFMDIWAHVTSVTPAQAKMDVHALGMDGTPVSGASVTLDYTFYDDGWEARTSTLTGTTSAAGVATFSLAYTDLGKDASTIFVSGRVKSGTITQLFEGYIYARERSGIEEGSSGDGFEASVVTVDPLVPGASITLESEVRYDGVPMESQEVFFYLTDAHGIYRFGTETSNAQGRFSFPLNVPTLGADERVRYLGIDYQVDVDGWLYDFDSVQVGEFLESRLLDDLIDPQTTMTVAPFSAGDDIDVTVDNPAADGVDENAFIIWSVGNTTDWDTFDNLPWQSWNPGTISILKLVPCVWSEGRYVVSIPCPEFLDTSSKIYMYGLITFTDQGSRFEAAKVAKKDGLSPAPPNPEPTATITNPVARERYGGKLKVQGTATDDTSVSKVELRLDGGAWMTVTGTTAWSYELDTKPLAAGNHTIEVRSYDGQKYSNVTTVAFIVDQSVVKKEDDGPGFGAAAGALAILAAVAAATVAGRRRRA